MNATGTAYDVLGVTSEATPGDLKAAWRALVKTHHPDRGGNPDVLAQVNVQTSFFTTGVDTAEATSPEEMSPPPCDQLTGVVVTVTLRSLAAYSSNEARFACDPFVPSQR